MNFDVDVQMWLCIYNCDVFLQALATMADEQVT